MLQVNNVVVSFDVLKEKFLCDLSACHGACCIEGDAGAPLELDETGVAVIVPSRRLAARVRPTSSNPFPAIFIPYG